jgi:hypothetical protein
MAEIDVEELGLVTVQDGLELIILSTIENGFHALDVFPLKAQKKIDSRSRQNFDVREGEHIGVLPRLGHNESLELAQSRDLPVDVLHLPLEESIAVAGDNGLMHEELSKPSPEVFASGFSEPSTRFRGLMVGELRFRRRSILSAG